jgi:hypothetical protein
MTWTWGDLAIVAVVWLAVAMLLWRVIKHRIVLQGCYHDWCYTNHRERLGGEWYKLYVCKFCGKEQWR